jgi:SnoaL-like domain
MTAQLLDRLAITETIFTERAARDLGGWEAMLATYHPDATLSISWFTGTAVEFVEASKKSYDAGIRATHTIGQPLVTINGDRALALATCLITCPVEIAGVASVMTSSSVLHERLERVDGDWKIVTLNAEYVYDALAPSNPSEHLAIDPERVKGYRKSYSMLCYLHSETGYVTSQNLPGADRPDLVEQLVSADEAWLAAA